MDEGNEETFPTETVQAIFKSVWKESNTRANKDAVLLACEFLKLFTTEAVHRAAAELDRSGSDNTEPNRILTDHLEQILSQLVLDF